MSEAHTPISQVSVRLLIGLGGYLLNSSVLMLLWLVGCAGYQIGNQALYVPDISTVYVPIFESDSFRRNLGERLTEAVIKEIELKTPYKVVGNPNADSILTGRLIFDTKRVLVENNMDLPRQTERFFLVKVSWVDRQGNLLRNPAQAPLSPNLISIGQATTLVPEAGQSIATAGQEGIERLATQIVAMMEAPW